MEKDVKHRSLATKGAGVNAGRKFGRKRKRTEVKARTQGDARGRSYLFKPIKISKMRRQIVPTRRPTKGRGSIWESGI